QKLSKKSFKTVLEGGGPNTHEFVHSTYFFLVNPDGQIVKKYDGLSDEEVDALVGDLKKHFKDWLARLPLRDCASPTRNRAGQMERAYDYDTQRSIYFLTLPFNHTAFPLFPAPE